LKETYDSRQSYLLWGGIALGIVSFLFACAICCGFSSLKMAIDVIDASADFLFLTKRIIIVPIIYFFLTLIFVFVWMGMMLCVISMNKIEPSKTIP